MARVLPIRRGVTAACAPRHAQDYQRIIIRAYQDILGRKPDRDEMRHFRIWRIDERWDESRFQAALRESDDFASPVRHCRQSGLRGLLHRKPDPQGRETYRNRVLRDDWDEQRLRRISWTARV
ncbi:hypothetical protein [Desulfonatronum thiosulfatophilum]|uniref:hypothetical protein n=1 Tax=Desulfonatronum thiosulfatophilum TaxID=617002 RepID=UPI001113630A|nr:hypothetical protein [Desulfonatronum thiosulfatophilum]